VTFYEQFELLDLLRDDGVKTFRARELATGRFVEVHVFANSQAPLSRALYSKVGKLADLADQGDGGQEPTIVTRGDYEGTPYVVTLPLDGFKSLHEWVFAMSHRVPADPSEPDRLRLSGAGAWRVTPPTETGAPPPLPEAPEPKELNGEQSLLETQVPFGRRPSPELEQPAVQADALHTLVKEPEESPLDEANPEEHRPESVAPAESPEPPEHVDPTGVVEPAPVEATPVGEAVALGEFALGGEPDDHEFSRLFAAPPAQTAPEPEVAAAPPPPATTPPVQPRGEFTRMIETLGKPSAPARANLQVPPPASPAHQVAKEPGEFTRMFQMPAQTPAKPPEPAPTIANQPAELTETLLRHPQQPAPSVAPQSQSTSQPPAPSAPQPSQSASQPLAPSALPPSQSAFQPPAPSVPPPSQLAPQPLAPSAPPPSQSASQPLAAAPPPAPATPLDRTMTLKMPVRPPAVTPPAEPPPVAAPPVARPTAPPSTAPPVTASASAPPEPPKTPPGEFTRMLQASQPPPSAPAVQPPTPTSNPAQPGAFTRAIQTAMPSPSPAGPSPWAAPVATPPGEFTRMIQSTNVPGSGAPPPGAGVKSSWNPPAIQQPVAGTSYNAGQPGEFTKMWQAPGTGVTPGGPQLASGGVPEKAGAIDLNRYLESPAGPMPQSPEVRRLEPQHAGAGGQPVGAYTQLFGTPNMPPTQPPSAAAPPAAEQPGAGATNAFAVPQAPAYPPAGGAYAGYNPYDPYNLYGAKQGPGEYTRVFSAPAPLTLGQEPPKPAQPPAAAYGAPPNPYCAPAAAPSPYGAPPAPAPYGTPAASPYGAPPAAPPPYGAAPAAPPYGATPAAPAYGAPPQAYGPPPAYGAPPQNYGAPGSYGAAAPPKTGPFGGSKLPLVIGGAGLLLAVILLILILVLKK
jgi:hypothetical protein